MKVITLAAIYALVSSSAYLITQAMGFQVLMVGNSYARRNGGYGSMLEAMLKESGESRVDVTTVASDGYSFKDHVNRGTVRNLLKDGSKSWDWVVLQDQSQIPGFGPGNGEFDESLSAALDLNERAANAGAKTVFLMTWGRRNGDSRNPDLYPNFIAMQRRLRDGYVRYVQNTSTANRPTTVAPVGNAYEALFIRSSNPLGSASDFYKLYEDDGSHPSPWGSYLTACVVYATITGRDPRDLTYRANGVDSAAAGRLRAVAAEVSLSNLPLDKPTSAPAILPSKERSAAPSTFPSNVPSTNLPGLRSMVPTSAPSSLPSIMPTRAPSNVPTGAPSGLPSNAPSTSPSSFPSSAPSSEPSSSPSIVPSTTPPRLRSIVPTMASSSLPSNVPTDAPSSLPSYAPSTTPSSLPSNAPSTTPSSFPSNAPSTTPSSLPTTASSTTPSSLPSNAPSTTPSSFPSNAPSTTPWSLPTTASSTTPSSVPSTAPSTTPSSLPSNSAELDEPDCETTLVSDPVTWTKRQKIINPCGDKVVRQSKFWDIFTGRRKRSGQRALNAASSYERDEAI